MEDLRVTVHGAPVILSVAKNDDVFPTRERLRLENRPGTRGRSIGQSPEVEKKKPTGCNPWAWRLCSRDSAVIA